MRIKTVILTDQNRPKKLGFWGWMGWKTVREHCWNKPQEPWPHPHSQLGRGASCLGTKKAGLVTKWRWSFCRCLAIILTSWDRWTNGIVDGLCHQMSLGSYVSCHQLYNCGQITAFFEASAIVKIKQDNECLITWGRNQHIVSVQSMFPSSFSWGVPQTPLNGLN